jgi:RNA polymerase sigma factor (sigma-70 family)
MGHASSNILADLVKRCKQGDKEAWTRLIELVAPLIFSISRKMKLSREEGFDIFGQVCYLLLKNIGSLRSADKLLAYVGTMTRREVYAMHRKSKIFEYLDIIVEGNLSVQEEHTPEKMYEITERVEKLMSAMVELPERDYRLLKLLFFDQAEPDYEEASRILGIPVASIGPTRARSLAKLQGILKGKRYRF